MDLHELRHRGIAFARDAWKRAQGLLEQCPVEPCPRTTEGLLTWRALTEDQRAVVSASYRRELHNLNAEREARLRRFA